MRHASQATALPSRADVIVVGGGHAGLCAAITARRAGASVLLLESAPRWRRGGNARHSRNMRVAHDAPTPLTPGRYTAEEFAADVRRVAGGPVDETLLARLAEDSAEACDWLLEQGARFQRADDGLLPWSRKTAFFFGGGKALVNSLYARAEALSVAIHYDHAVSELFLGDATARVLVRHGDLETSVAAGAIVVAAGGFQANRAWLRETWGEAADTLQIRGTPHATGGPLRALLDLGAQPVGDPAHGHVVAVDARSPAVDGGIVTRIDDLTHGIVVDRDGRRFADEGSDIGPPRYAVWGERVLRRPGQTAFAIADATVEPLSRPPIDPPIRADSLPALASALGLPPETLTATVAAFNAAIRPDGPDGDHTEGLDPPKSRRARPIAVPPFSAVPLRPGLTVTAYGVRVDERARVLDGGGQPLGAVFAAGVIMAPNILGRGYPAGSAMTIGTVFGRIAGREAAALATRRPAD